MSERHEERYQVHTDQLNEDKKDQQTNQELVINTSRWEQAQTQPISRINKFTPLVFKLEIWDCHYVSYRQDLRKRFIPQFIAISLVATSLIIALHYIQISNTVSTTLTSLILIDMILFFILSFLDAGTLFQDEEEDFYEERVYCTVCGYYRVHTTRHCPFCNKCTRKYDHHCSFFGKCIGARNICFFYLFSVVSSSTMIGCFLTIIYSLINFQVIVKL